MMPSSKAVFFARQMMRKVRVTTPSMSATRFVSTGDYQYPPEPIPNRPLRGERPPRSSENALSDNGFLEQFKIGVSQDSQEAEQRPSWSEDSYQQPEHKPWSEDPDEIFQRIKEGGLIPNAVAMLDGLCQDGRVQEAMDLFGQMREQGTVPEVVIYTAVVEGFFMARRTEDAKRIFRKMQSNGISPNSFSYCVLVQGSYYCDMLDEAVDFCGEMLESGHSPNIPTFVGLVDALCREKGLEQAQSVIESLKQKGFDFNAQAVKEFMEETAPFPSLAWEAIFKKKPADPLF